MIEQEDFATLVMEDAESVIDRQEADSIPIIDDLKFYLAEFYTVDAADIDETSEKMKLLYDFLERLNLDS